jgi:nicotinamide mononucleotide adenylyltransferase
MENGILIGVLGLIAGYSLYKFLNKKQRSSTSKYSDMSELESNSEHAQKSEISDILTKDKCQVRGQWDR